MEGSNLYKPLINRLNFQGSDWSNDVSLKERCKCPWSENSAFLFSCAVAPPTGLNKTSIFLNVWNQTYAYLRNNGFLVFIDLFHIITVFSPLSLKKPFKLSCNCPSMKPTLKLWELHEPISDSPADQWEHKNRTNNLIFPFIAPQKNPVAI